MEVLSRCTDPSWRAERLRWFQNVLAVPAAITLLGLLVGSALLLVVRRSAGALSEPLSARSLILVGLCVATAVVGSRYLNGRVPLPAVRGLGFLLRWGTTLSVAMFAVALAIEGTSLPAMAIYLVLIVGAEFFAERGAWIFGKSRFTRASFQPSTKPASDRLTERPEVTSADSRAEIREASSIAVDELPELEVEDSNCQLPTAAEALDELPEATLEGAWQQVTRARTPEGELVTGWVKAEFQPGERTAVLHVAFCPPLAQTPEFEIEQLSGPAARIKAAQVLPQGARLEIRLNGPAIEVESLMVAFVATGPLSDQ